MNRYLITICAIVLLSLQLATAAEHPSHDRHEAHTPDWTRHCTAIEDLGLSRKQRDAVSMIDKQYREKIMECYQACMLKRIELRALLRSSDANEKMIMDLSRAHLKIREQLYSLIVEYQIRIRQTLTPDQRHNWCTMMNASGSHSGW
nr:hypothetical protein [uncultured Desulfobacter sp.]